MAKVQNVFSLNGTILAVLCFSLNVKFFLTKKVQHSISLKEWKITIKNEKPIIY